MTAKIYLENKLVKTKYFQTNRQSKESISKGISQLVNDFALIGLKCHIVLTSKHHSKCNPQ